VHWSPISPAPPRRTRRASLTTQHPKSPARSSLMRYVGQSQRLTL
jgi:hypothetical protein